MTIRNIQVVGHKAQRLKVRVLAPAYQYVRVYDDQLHLQKNKARRQL